MQKTNEQEPKKRNRKITVIILSLLGLCLLTAGLSIISNQFLPKASPSTDRLTQEDLFRAEETLNLMTDLGEQTWPGLNSSIPLILWNESHAFLLNSQEHFEDWRVLEGATVNNLPVYVQENKANYQAFTELLSNGRYAGSMATKDATNIGFITLFRENLPPVISQIFPYRILLLSTDHYITALVHESFHAYQAENYPERFDDAEKSYQSTDAYEDIFPDMSEDWQIEVQFLLDALEEEDRVKQITLVKDFLETRENRREKAGLPENLVLYEKRYEWLEGSAKYVELEIWKQAANSTEYQPVDEIFIDQDFDDYQGYEKRWKNEKTSMKNAAKNIGDSLFYYTGMLQGRLLDILMPDWKTKINDPGIWYEDLLRDAIS
jgi:hypothetical protein